MAIKIVEGVPGAGKTYYAIKHVVDQYFDIESDGTLVSNSEAQIFTNIDGFIGEHVSLQNSIDEAGGVKQFFSNANQKQLFDQLGPIVYVIDEAQMVFDRKFYDREVFSWFEYHRHYGQTIYLVTQSVQKLPKDITLLVEYVIKALARSRSITGKEFRYNHVSGKDILKRDILPIQKKYFDFYKSADADEVENVKNPFLGRIGFYMLFICLGLGGSIYFIKTTWSSTTPQIPVSSQSVSSFAPSGDAKSDIKNYFENHHVQPGEQVFDSVSTFNEIRFQYIYSLNYIGTYGDKAKIKILFNGNIYSVGDFPYPIEIDGVNLRAVIPSHEFEFLFEELPPSRTWCKRIIRS